MLTELVCSCPEKATITGLSVTTNGITNTLSDQSVPLGSSVNITCHFRGTPTPTLFLLHNGVKKTTFTTGSLQRTLTIPNFQCGQAGVYQCSVENEYQISLHTVVLAAAG